MTERRLDRSPSRFMIGAAPPRSGCVRSVPSGRPDGGYRSGEPRLARGRSGLRDVRRLRLQDAAPRRRRPARGAARLWCCAMRRPELSPSFGWAVTVRTTDSAFGVRVSILPPKDGAVPCEGHVLLPSRHGPRCLAMNSTDLVATRLSAVTWPSCNGHMRGSRAPSGLLVIRLQHSGRTACHLTVQPFPDDRF